VVVWIMSLANGYWSLADTCKMSRYKRSCSCSEKQSCPKIFHCVEILYFISFMIFEQLALALKNRLCLKFFAVLKYFLSFRIFEQLVLGLNTEFAQKFLTVVNILFAFRIFEQLCACPEKQSLPWIHWIEYIFFIVQDFWAACGCPEKQSSLKFFTVLKYCILYHSWFLSNLCLPWKTVFALNSLHWI